MVQVISNPLLCDLSPTYSEQLESATSRLMLANAPKKTKHAAFKINISFPRWIWKTLEGFPVSLLDPGIYFFYAGERTGEAPMGKLTALCTYTLKNQKKQTNIRTSAEPEINECLSTSPGDFNRDFKCFHCTVIAIARVYQLWCFTNYYW